MTDTRIHTAHPDDVTLTGAFWTARQQARRAVFAGACAAIPFAMWAVRAWQDRGDVRYLDVVERTLYNGLLGAPCPPGDAFFYAYPESDGDPACSLDWAPEGCAEQSALFSTAREAGFSYACCPPRVARWLEQAPGLFYGQDDGGCYVNLYSAGVGHLPWNGQTVTLVQETRYPWEGEVEIRVVPERAERFSLTLRIPGWARGKPTPTDRYRFTGPGAPAPVVRLNGIRVPATPALGSVRLDRIWEPGDVLGLELPMPVRRIVASPAEADRGRVALQRGPLVYCTESEDLGGHVDHLVLPDDAVLVPAHRERLAGSRVPGGVTVLTGEARREGEPVPFVAIPYAVSGRRRAVEMAVWLRRQT